MIRIAIVGVGGYARHHISEFCRLGVPIVALVDPNQASIERAKADFPGVVNAQTFASFEAFIVDLACDAVVISTPHTLHVSQVEQCFAHGLHVLCDKPLTTSVADAQRVIAARDQSGKVGAIAYQRHGEGPWRWLRAQVQAGSFGAVRMVNSHLGQGWLQGTRGSWRQQKALSGGGQLNDSGSHMLDVLLWATGLKASLVSAMMDFCGTEVDINSAVNVRFDSGAMATVTIIGDGALWHERHYIWFEDAMVTLADGQVEVSHRDGTHFVVDRFTPGPGVQENFLRAVEHGDAVLAPFECGLRTIELTEAAWRSHESGGATVSV